MSEPVVIDNCVPLELHKDLWATCQSPNWYFGHLPNYTDDPEAHLPPWWRMDLDGNPAADAVWRYVQGKCESAVGKPLKVLRQYANGHTFGSFGGQPHKDGEEGSYTFLYYPMLEWPPNWDGETVFYEGSGPEAAQPQPTEWKGFERTIAVRPLPNRGVLFDARLSHGGRAPSRYCTTMRVTVAYKLKEI
jgi:hypothetical protein